MTTYHTTTDSGHTLEFIAGRTAQQLVVYKPSEGGVAVTLSDRDLRELAFEILEAQFDVTYPIAVGEGIKLTKKVPPRPLPRVGEFYRVNSVPTMVPGFRDNPIVKVEVAPPVAGASFFVRTAEGTGARWYAMDNLEGPLDVREVVSWVVK